jgi:hypothetical protein
MCVFTVNVVSGWDEPTGTTDVLISSLVLFITTVDCHVNCKKQSRNFEVNFLIFQSPMVTVCTAHWSLYVLHTGHYMYRTLVTICTAHWSLYVPHTGHYMYCTLVTICTAHWSLYVPHTGHYIYQQFNIQQFYVLPHTAVFMCFV